MTKLQEMIERALKPKPKEQAFSEADLEAMNGALRLLLVEVESLRELRHEVRDLRARLGGIEVILRERSRGF